MKNALTAIVLFVSFLFCSLPAAGQNSLPAASQRSLDDQLWKAISGVDGSQAVVLLLKRGANIEARKPSSGDTVLIRAAELGKTRMVRLLLERGANIEAKDNDGTTPLGIAETAEVAQLLLDRGANIEARDKTSYTPLIQAALCDRTEVVKLLLEKGANIEARNAYGDTALLAAVASIGTIDRVTELVKLLLAKGANIEAKNNQGDTALFYALHTEETKVNSTEIMNLLMDNGANIEAKDNNGETPLIRAAMSGKINAMKLLLDRGANIEAKDNSGETALIWTALLATVGPVGNDIYRTTEVMKLLLAKGANIEAKNNQGDTALDLANRNKSMAVADLLEQARRKRKQLEEAQARDPRNIFAANLNAFQQSPRDESLREKVIQLAISLPEPPPIPEEARQMFLLATSQIKQASGPPSLAQPIGLLRKALKIAPWWGNAYYNLSRALEMSGQYDEAMKQLKYYLELKPSEADAQEARAHLVVIQTEKDTATGKQQ